MEKVSVDEQRANNLDITDSRISLTMSDFVDEIFSNADAASSLGAELSRCVDRRETISFDWEFESEQAAIEALARYSISQNLATRIVFGRLAAAIDALIVASAQPCKPARTSRGGQYRPRN
jgi:hypothetical protein